MDFVDPCLLWKLDHRSSIHIGLAPQVLQGSVAVVVTTAKLKRYFGAVNVGPCDVKLFATSDVA